jgi:predicted amidophosphoribosyltransferase
MSSLTKCPSCSSEVSTKAASCPKCGHQFKSAGGLNLSDPVHIVGLIIVGLMILGFLIFIAQHAP